MALEGTSAVLKIKTRLTFDTAIDVQAVEAARGAVHALAVEKNRGAFAFDFK